MFNFLRKKRRDKFLCDQIATIAAKINVNSLICSSSLDSNFQSVKSYPLAPLVFSQITVEYLMLFIHLTDRVLFHLFGPEDRSRYINLLVALISESLKGDSISESFPKFKKTLDVKEKVRISPTMRNKADDYIIEDGLKISMDIFCIDEMNMRTIEYTKYENVIPSGDDSPQGTLLWEFGKNISYVMYDHQNDIDTIKLSSQLAAKGYAKIDVKTLLTKTT